MNSALAARLLQSQGMAASNSKSQTVTPESQSQAPEAPEHWTSWRKHHGICWFPIGIQLPLVLLVVNVVNVDASIFHKLIFMTLGSKILTHVPRHTSNCQLSHVPRPVVWMPTMPTHAAVFNVVGSLWSLCMTKFGISFAKHSRLTKSEIWDRYMVWLMFDSCWLCLSQKSQKVKKKHEIMRFILYHFVICVFPWVFELPIFLSTADQLWDDCKEAEPITGWTMHRMGVPFQTKRMYHLHPPVSCGFFGSEILYLL